MRNEWTEGKVREQGEGCRGRRTETALEEPDRKCIYHLVSREVWPSRRGLWWAWWWWRSKRGGDTSSGLQPSSGWIISQSSQMSRVSQGKLGPARAPCSSWCKTIKLPIRVGNVKGAARIHATGVYAFLALPSPPTISCISLRAQQGHKPHCSTSSPAGLGWLPGAAGGLTPITGNTPQSQGVAKGEQRFRHWFTSSLATRTFSHPSLPSLPCQVGGFACFQLFLDASFSPDLDFFGFGFQTCKAV